MNKKIRQYLMSEAEHEPGKDVYWNIKLGDTVKGVDPSDGLILNNKTLNKKRMGYELKGMDPITGDKIDVFFTDKEMDYMLKNYKSLK